MPWFVNTPASCAKLVKTRLDTLGWRDKQEQVLKITSPKEGHGTRLVVAFPLASSCPGLPVKGDQESQEVQEAIIARLPLELQRLIGSGDLEVAWRDSGESYALTRIGTKKGRGIPGYPGEGPRSIMKYLFAQAIRDMEPDLEDEVVNAQIKGIPERWELYKDFALLSPRALIDPPIEERFQALAIASISRVLGVGHLARKSAIPKEDPLRRPKLIPLLGTFSSASPSSHQPVDPSPGTLTEEEVEGEFWTRIKQHGVTYVWAPARTMFSTGNITEKDRVSRLGKEGEVVVDLFAGIGYFSLVFARRCRARLVHACEWNPWSIQGLCRGAKANGIPYLVHGQQEGRIPPRMIIYPGDNALAGPHFIGQADRVHLGLLPDAEGSFGLACQSLRPTGGWMHVHANVLDGQEKMWGKRVENLLRDHLQRIHSHTVTWMVRVRWLERVKGWSPGIGHWVADVECCREAVPVP